MEKTLKKKLETILKKVLEEILEKIQKTFLKKFKKIGHIFKKWRSLSVLNEFETFGKFVHIPNF